MGAAAFAVVAAVAIYGHHPKVDRTPSWGYCQVCDRETPHLGIRCAYTSSHVYVTGYFDEPYEGALRFDPAVINLLLTPMGRST